MAEESAYDLAVNLFNEFRNDAFFVPAFKSLSYTEITTTGSPYGGGTTMPTEHEAICLEVGGNAKRKMVSQIDSIQATDVMVKGLYEEITPPTLGKQFTFNGDMLTVVYVASDSVGATFDLFGRGS